MRVGTSLSRCVLDIYNGTVDINDVMVLVTRTDFDPENDSQWKRIWNGYAGGNGIGSGWSEPEWASIPEEDEQKIRDLCIKLKQTGKLHQPRQFGAWLQRMPDYWYDLILTNDTLQSNPAVKAAWDNYNFIAGLSK